mmetsp:Transcript_63355/g.112526  ORF Transcript_63355/g.112526 Transcript_63355/m.112526 type:complete len:352 (-) Transcript_63355:30-1085(-)
MAIDAPPVDQVVKGETSQAEDIEPAKKAANETATREKPCSSCPLLLTILYGASLSCCDGYINANTKMRFNTYGGMMTGNTVSLGKSFALEEWEDVALFATIIALFFSGALLASLVGRYKKQGSFRYLAIFVGLGFVVLEALAQAVKKKEDSKKDQGQRWASVISSFLMGMVDLIGFKGSLGQHVTFMTGNLQKLAGTTLDVVALKKSHTPDESKPNTTKRQAKKISTLKQTLCIVGTIWAFYVVGAIIGAEMSKAGDKGAWTLCLPAAIIALLMFINEGPDKSPSEPKKDPPLFRLFNVEGRDGITISDLQNLYAKLGLTLSAEEEKRFHSADSNDDGMLDRDEFRAWFAV